MADQKRWNRRTSRVIDGVQANIGSLIESQEALLTTVAKQQRIIESLKARLDKEGK